jgi:hypothetical protein
MLVEFAPTLRDRGAAFQQNGSQLINQRGALAQSPLALQLDEPHRGLVAILRIAIIVLLQLDVGAVE